MFSSALRVHECCAACRRPVGRCGCSSAKETYAGVLLRGEWREMPRTEEDQVQELRAAAH